jgi:hypothetical protein
MTAGGLGVPGRYSRHPHVSQEGGKAQMTGASRGLPSAPRYRLRAPLMLSLLPPRMVCIDVTWGGYSRFTAMLRLVTALNS